MKVRAAPAVRDAGDLRMLLRALDIHSVEQATEIVARYFPDEPLTVRPRQLLEDILNPDG